MALAPKNQGACFTTFFTNVCPSGHIICTKYKPCAQLLILIEVLAPSNICINCPSPFKTRIVSGKISLLTFTNPSVTVGKTSAV